MGSRSLWWAGLWRGIALVGVMALWIPAGPIEGDSPHYLQMVRGSVTDAPSPFAYRVAAPLLARAFPSAELGLQSLTLLSLVLVCACVFVTGRRLGYSASAMTLALLAVSTTPGWGHHFHNPYMTDGLGLLAVSVSLQAWLAGALVWALVAVFVGCLARETVAATGAFWLFSAPRWRGALALLAGAVVVLGIQRWPGMPSARPPLETLRYVMELKGPVKILGDALGSWHLLWAVAGVGGWLAPAERRRRVALPLALLVAAAAAMSLIAVNTNRMFTFALPAMTLAIAEFFSALEEESPWRARLLVAVLATGVPLWFAARPFGELLSGNKRLRVLYALVLLVAAVPQLWRVVRRRSSLAPLPAQSSRDDAAPLL